MLPKFASKDTESVILLEQWETKSLDEHKKTLFDKW